MVFNKLNKVMEILITRAKTRQEIAFEYGIDRKTFNKWLKVSGLFIPPGIINPKQIRKIYKTFGSPKIPKIP
jgi:hypothetical protein